MSILLQQQLGTELLRSEKRRTIILIFMFLAAVVFRLVYLSFFSAGDEFATINTFQVVWLFPTAIIGFELFTLFYINTRLKSNAKQIPLALQFLNTGVEVSLPSLVLLLVADQYPELNVMQSPAVYVYFIFIILSTLRLNFLLSFFCGSLACGYYVLISLLLNQGFSINDAMRAVILLFSGIASGLVARQIKAGISRSLLETEKRSQLVNLFGKHLSKEIAQKMLENDGRVESKRMNVAVMFIDIRNFTAFVAGKSPEEIVQYQNSFFSIVIDAIAKHDGVVNQFLGDGCMVTFGAPVALPNPSKNAVNASLELLKQLEVAMKSGALDFTKIGIGIHTGEAVTGNIGTATRQQYSVTGNVVIMASRIEQLNKQFESQVLISGDVIKSIGVNLIKALPLGEIPLKGLEFAPTIYKVA